VVIADFKKATAPAYVNEFKMPQLASFAVPPSPGAAVPPTPDFGNFVKSELRSNTGALSQILKAKSVPPTDSPKLVELLDRGLQAALSQQDAKRVAGASATVGGRRLLSIWDDIAGFFEDLGCGAFATGALPGYLAAYAWFHAGNSGYDQLSTHQKFFQRSQISADILNKVNVKYSANFPPGFGSAAATTMGTEIYVRAPKTNVDTNGLNALSVSSAFKSQTRLLIHELTHSEQYAARGWSVAVFGWDYLDQYCKAGFSYSGNSMEVAANARQPKADALFTDPVVAHFKEWRRQNLALTVGFSKSATETSDFSLNGVKIFSILETKGTATTGESQRKANTRCIRALRQADLPQRKSAAIANRPWNCIGPTPAPTEYPTLFKPGTFGTPQPTKKGDTPFPTVYIPPPKLTAGGSSSAVSAPPPRKPGASALRGPQDIGDK
jgi:hypothetical protein